MESVIYKYAVPANGVFEIALPPGAHILHVETQHTSLPFIWVKHSAQKEKLELRKFRTVMTGEIFEDATEYSYWNYIGTFLLDGGHYVGHVFEERPIQNYHDC